MIRFGYATILLIALGSALLLACTPTPPDLAVALDSVATAEATATGEATATAATATPDNGYPGPDPTTVPQETPEPLPTLIEIGPGLFAEPTFTPFPSRTPLPTPTRRPGPTPTAVPPSPPPDNPAGIIRYATLSDPPYHGTYSHFAIHMDAQGTVSKGPTLIDLPSEIASNISYIYPSPNGKYDIFLWTSMPGGIPYIFNNASGDLQTIDEIYGSGTVFSWHPDGYHFLFWRDHDGIWLINAETHEITNLTIPQSIVQGAAISPDGQTVAYIDANYPDIAGALWFVSIAGSDAEPILDAGGIAYMHSGAWSPDGVWLIYRGDCPSASEVNHFTTPLCLYNVQTKSWQFLELPFVVAYDPPYWSPDSQSIVTTGLTEGEKPCDLSEREEEPIACQFIGQTVYTHNLATGEAKALAAGISPIWSPDGSMIAFVSYVSGATEIWTVRLDGTGLQQLTNDGQFKSPNGRLSWIAEVTNND